MCDIINLTKSDLRLLKKNNNTNFYDCVWSMNKISTEYLKHVNPNIERLNYIRESILTFEPDNRDNVNTYFDELITRS
jgi:hypothetical protein